VIEGILGLGGTYKCLRDVFCTSCCLSPKIIFFFVSSDGDFLGCCQQCGLQLHQLDLKLCIAVFIEHP